jgi:hypothetical protein
MLAMKFRKPHSRKGRKAMKAMKKKASPMKAMKKKVIKKAMKAVKRDSTNQWTKKEEALFRTKLNSPAAIQVFLDSLGYDGADEYFSVRTTLRTRKAHCMGGALLAACALQRLGLGPPRIMGLDARNDDNHAVAVYQKNGYWGAVGKSNFTLIRSREPVYRTVRELVMSYFDFYFNTKCEMSLKAYSGPYNLDRRAKAAAGHSKDAWKFGEGNIEDTLDSFDYDDETPWIPIRPPGMRQPALGRASKHLLRAGLLGSNPKGLYKPR